MGPWWSQGLPPRLPHWKAGAPGCCLTLSATAPPHVALPMPWGKIQVLCLALTYNSAPACSPGLTSHHVLPCGAFPSATLPSSAGNTPLPGTHCSAFKTQLQRRLLWKPFPTSATPSPAPLQGRVTQHAELVTQYSQHVSPHWSPSLGHSSSRMRTRFFHVCIILHPTAAQCLS